MASEAKVQVRKSSIERSWKASGGMEVWLLLKGGDTKFAQFVGAVDATNARWAMRSPEIGSFPSTSPAGHVVCVLDITGRAALADWVDTLRQELEGYGARGSLTSAPEAYPPAWVYAAIPPTLATFAAWSIDVDSMTSDPQRNANWHVPPAATDAICALASQWAIEPGVEVILRQGIFRLKVDSDDVAVPLARGIRATGMAGVEAVQEEIRRCRYVSLNPGGDTLFQTVDDTLGWEEHLQELRSALVGLPEHTNHAFIRHTARGAWSAIDLDRIVPLPGIRESRIRRNKHLFAEYVPDAHGMQVLRDAHLQRAPDLARWNVSELGHGRYLVEAPDLEPWYANPLPDEAVLAQARQDFAPILLTEDVIRRTPAPWL